MRLLVTTIGSRLPAASRRIGGSCTTIRFRQTRRRRNRSPADRHSSSPALDAPARELSRRLAAPRQRLASLRAILRRHRSERRASASSMPAVSTSSHCIPSSDDCRGQIVARRSALRRNERRVTPHCRLDAIRCTPNRATSALNRLLLPTFGGPTSATCVSRCRRQPRRHLLGHVAKHAAPPIPAARTTSAGEMNSMSSSTKSRPASSSASSCSNSSRNDCSGRASPPANCDERRVELVVAARVDHAEHRFGLRQIEPAGQKRPQA